MKYLRYLALVGLLTVMPFTCAQARVRFGIDIGVGPGYVAAPPVCAYGYYPDYPYACAPYGYYGPEWFVSGVFIGAGPWYHGWGRPYWDRGLDRPGFYGRDHARISSPQPDGGRAFAGRGYEGRAPVVAPRGRGDFHGEGFHGGEFHGGGARGGR